MAPSRRDADTDRVQQLFESSADAVFAIDIERRLRFVNAALMRLLGKVEAQLLGQPCCDVICGQDLAARPFCNPECPVARQALRQQRPANFDLVITRHDGERCWVNVGTYALPASVSDGEPARVFFALRGVSGHRLIQQLASELAGTAPARAVPVLTAREAQVLGLAAQGLDTAGIGDQLAITPQTVRNHFKSIFSKLGVRSRAQAVALALQRRLVG